MMQKSLLDSTAPTSTFISPLTKVSDFGMQKKKTANNLYLFKEGTDPPPFTISPCVQEAIKVRCLLQHDEWMLF
jgi:hypothetical protein